MLRIGVLAVLGTVSLLASTTIVVDEYGNMLTAGVPSQGIFTDDPGPGGQANILTYTLPFAGLQGDVGIQDLCGCPSDVIRFNSDGTLLFYSNPSDGFDSLADAPLPPQDLYANFVLLTETGDDVTFGGVTYTPVDGDPGFDPSNPTYVILSVGSIPEPGSLSLVAAGLGALLIFVRRRSARA